MKDKTLNYFYTCSSYSFDDEGDEPIPDLDDYEADWDLLNKLKNAHHLEKLMNTTFKACDQDRLRQACGAYSVLEFFASQLAGKAYLFYDPETGICEVGLRNLYFLMFADRAEQKKLADALETADDFTIVAQPGGKFRLCLSYEMRPAKYRTT